ncbi:lysozyme [Gammaproteobacteria bacterium]
MHPANEKLEISNFGLLLIKSFEGLKLSAYQDAAGFMTIGYGHKIKPDDDIPIHISEDQANAILAHDASIACHAVKKLVMFPLTQGEIDALTSFTFNLGAGALKKSTLLKLVNEGKMSLASIEFGKWINAGGKPLEGLRRRREAERKLFMGGLFMGGAH